MVARSDDHDENCSMCPTCRFRRALAAYVAELAAAREATWHGATGELLLALNTAVLTLSTMRVERSAGRPAVARATANMAAGALVTIARKVEELHELLDDEDDE